MQFPSLALCQEKLQTHFVQNRTTYTLIGTYTLTAYVIHSKWGSVAVIVWTASVIGVYSKIQRVSQWALESKMSALFPVMISVVAIFSPLLGIGLGVLTSGAHWWKDQNLVQIVKKSEAVVQQLPIHNAQLGNISAEMEIKLKELEQEYNKCLAIVQKIQAIVFQHTKSQEILGSTDQKLSDQFQKIEEKLQQLFSMGELAAISHQAKSENLVQETQAIHQQTENLVRNVDRNLTQLDQMTGMVGNLLKTVASQLTHNP